MSSKSIKIAIVSGASKNDDAVRGIGVHTSQLFEQLRQLSINNYQFSITKSTSQADIVHFTVFRPFFISLPFFKSKNQKLVLTIHDLIPLIYPNHYPAGIRGKIKFLINKFLVWKNIDQIITISETSKKDICRFLQVDPKIVNVIYLAPKEIYKKSKVINNYKLPNKFVLYTGDINYNKNIPNLIKACEIAKIPLVIAGKHAKEIQNMDLKHAELKHLNNIDWSGVIRVGFVPDEILVDLYNLATVYVQPSLYEGFGLPVLDAVACGTPIVVTKTQALVEILGTNLNYVDPNDPKDMARGILNPNKNIKLPREYSWQKTAEETLEVYVKA
ncbi:hypothetical protein A2130_03485 [Candidatus Woesebacteria bacterium GWC2_33_12]|uniref:Glycosyl transferase group 1 n=1 Tax=Candidatus Woesebacteria bacterium GW2011_GWB1_33_22 TaxID=1618566 RepID=A0A0G0A2K5_9BACT|nr:MAG: Glycosyl transferase group 1 [Candidatus Woesebacteria bacterium GW2011_GWC2_33_12]KKP42774.1 MAG: Glycosyl transferase group 1 [Candidatus Woesebacteria bacterium GW2011_GWA2_33_20]KKP45451.1 MAG: Glycosyl transferase group 1 [Candidatus Woesebacteria bacterium GW2011_GWB1_33_22]KKP47323.1 MAG: Glycosyl transferase group 1 [Microgenomates group bacterium GW2011_GWC1_33_28]KKP51069.1 MAG: Glycosyl transferase group 1 [Candidatus Woesebacteria bacterium GW2011_GWA1_33_33]OGM06864.1 MAG: